VGRPRKLSSADSAELMQLRVKHTTAEIAQMKGVAPSVIYDALKRLPDYATWKAGNVGKVASARVIINEAAAQSVHKLLAKGYGKAELCRRFNVSMNALNGALLRHPAKEVEDV
jgi:hypothetical protein